MSLLIMSLEILLLFSATHLKKVSKMSIGDIAIRGLITPIIEHLVCVSNEDISHSVAGKSILDMESLIAMGMIEYFGDTFTIMIRERSILDLPNPRRVRVDNKHNLLYDQGIRFLEDLYEEEDIPDFYSNDREKYG